MGRPSEGGEAGWGLADGRRGLRQFVCVQRLVHEAVDAKQRRAAHAGPQRAERPAAVRPAHAGGGQPVRLAQEPPPEWERQQMDPGYGRGGGLGKRRTPECRD